MRAITENDRIVFESLYKKTNRKQNVCGCALIVIIRWAYWYNICNHPLLQWQRLTCDTVCMSKAQLILVHEYIYTLYKGLRVIGSPALTVSKLQNSSSVTEMWFEFSPHESGFLEHGAYVDTSLLNKNFDGGHVKPPQKKPVDMVQLQGFCYHTLTQDRC